jgi:ketosteroid isomerase-like protein
VEALRRAYDHFNGTHEPPYELMAPDIAWHTAADLPDTGTHHGHQDIARVVSEWSALYDDFRVDPLELIEAGEHVVAWCRLRGRGRDSGAWVELSEAHVWKFHEGQAVEVHEFRTRAAALEAVGLSEQDAHADS